MNSFTGFQVVLTTSLDLLVEPAAFRVEWRFAWGTSGAQFVMTAGIMPMLVWCVAFLDTPVTVRW